MNYSPKKSSKSRIEGNAVYRALADGYNDEPLFNQKIVKTHLKLAAFIRNAIQVYVKK